MKLHYPAAATAALQASLSLASNNASQVGKTVSTTSGRILGHAAPNATAVSEYLGIPFAKPPVGELRFAPPVAFASDEAFAADSFAPMCPQPSVEIPDGLPPSAHNLVTTMLGNSIPMAEDCLHLNVWTKPQSGSASKPVLVWLYGGGFTSGATANRAYNGQYFVDREDVVIVSVGYRVNVFGFPAGPSLTKNVGLLDQRLALEWTRKNIAAFGGNPDRITLFGQSAGGASVDLYSYAWPHDPIVSGSILHSGAAVSFGNFKESTVEQAWNKLTEELGCREEAVTPDEVVDCMRRPEITAADITDALASIASASDLGAFGPTIDNITVFDDYSKLAAEGKHMQRPILAGNANKESGFFKLFAQRSEEEWFANDQISYTCPASAAARHWQIQGIPSYRYYYSALFPNQVLPTATNLSEAYHTAELLPLFGTSQEVTGLPESMEERQQGDYLRSAWATFAREPENGLSEAMGWPLYDYGGSTVVMLGYENKTDGFSTVRPDKVDQLCTFPWPGVPNW